MHPAARARSRAGLQGRFHGPADLSTPTMSNEPNGTCLYFLTYTGIKLPFKLVTPLTTAEVDNRNTFFKGYFDGERLLGFDKMVYGEIELAHRYTYRPDGSLAQAVITDIDGDSTVLGFDETGSPA